jgi:hypothetical protein
MMSCPYFNNLKIHLLRSKDEQPYSNNSVVKENRNLSEKLNEDFGVLIHVVNFDVSAWEIL